MDTIDFTRSASTLADLVRATADDQLAGPTPCVDYTVGDLVEHIGGLARGFVLSARKEPMPPDELRDGDASYLEEGWREQIAADLEALVAAWREPDAYDGDTWAGPVELPASAAAAVALDEVVVHGWDLAVSTGQVYRPDATAIAVCTEFVRGFDAPANDDGGLFGPPVDVGPEATDLERLLALTGRDPAWQPRTDHAGG